MANLGDKVVLNTVKGPAYARVIDADIPTGVSSNEDDDTQLVVFASTQVAGPETGLDEGLNLRYSHENDQAGGYSPA